MKNFQPGGLRNRREDIGGRPRGDINSYAPKQRSGGSQPAYKKSFGGKPSGGFNPKDRAPRENKSYPAVCSDCGKACDVPFRPDGVKPVLCRDCYAKKGGTPTTGRDRFSSSESRPYTPAPAVPNAEIAQMVKQLAALEAKMHELMELIKAGQMVAPVTAPKKVAAKKAPAKKAAVKKAAKK